MNKIVFFALIIITICSCSNNSAKSVTSTQNSIDSLEKTVSSEIAFDDFLELFPVCKLPYPEGFSTDNSSAIPNQFVEKFISNEKEAINSVYNLGVYAEGRFELPDNRVGVIFHAGQYGKSEYSEYLFIYEANGELISKYQLGFLMKDPLDDIFTYSKISTNLQILTFTTTGKLNLNSNEMEYEETFSHYAIVDGLIWDMSFE